MMEKRRCLLFGYECVAIILQLFCFVLAHEKKRSRNKKSQPQKAMELFEINKTKHYISADEMETFYFEIGMVSRSPLSQSRKKKFSVEMLIAKKSVWFLSLIHI